MRVDLLGFSVEKISMRGCVEWAEARLKRASLGHQIIVLNVAKLVNARHEPILLKSLQSADLVVADGAPLVWLSRLLRDPLPERVAGIDLMEQLLISGNQKGWSFFFFGAEQIVITQVVAKVTRDFPNIRLAGFRNGYFREDEEQSIVRDIAASHANVLFIGFGSPKKEIFVEKILNCFIKLF